MASIDPKNILHTLLSLPGETEVVEFKTASRDFHFDKIGKYFSALCNEANLLGRGDAWLIFGVNDSREIVGSNYRQGNRAALDSLKGEISKQTTTNITFNEIYEIVEPEGRVVLFRIPAAPQGIPISWGGHYYGRNGEELCALNLEEIERIRKQSRKIDWSAELCVGATINDLDEEAIKIARANFKVKNPRIANDIDQWNTVTLLNKAKICINGKITRTAIILLGKPESEHFLSPAIARITWVLKDKMQKERDYEHFSCPLLTSVDKVYSKIRNLKYRYISDETSLFPEEVEQYSPQNIREALNNCIAHQNYELAGRINVVEEEDGYLSFTNVGDFLPGSVENVITSDSPPNHYRNNFLTNAMASLNMIDTIGSGIKRMFRLQMEKYFPMPDYELDNEKVKVTLTGKVLDMDYARVLVRNPNLSLHDIMLLDKIQKRKELNDAEIHHLKDQGFIEGRKPNFHISLTVATKTDQLAEYIKNRGFKDDVYKKMILEFIDKHGSASKGEIYGLILDFLPSVLSPEQKDNKVRNLMYSMSKREFTIVNSGSSRYPKWVRTKQS